MRFVEMGLAFAAVGFVAANAAISLLVVLLWRVAESSLRRAGPLFLLRMAPALGSAAFVLGLVVPAYCVFEPRSTAERAGPTLAALIALSGGLAAAGVGRAAVSWRKTRRLERAWLAAALRTAEPGFSVPTYRVPSALPLAALVGIVRPRLFVSGPFIDALTPNERRALLEHENAHLRSLDNLKRIAMKLAPDYLGMTATGRQIETAWTNAAEEEADDRAAGTDRRHVLDLAGALLKASRLMPMRCAPVSNFCEDATIARRVARLLSDPPPAGGDRTKASRFVVFLALVAAAAFLAGPGLPAAYAMTEAAVRLLQ